MGLKENAHFEKNPKVSVQGAQMRDLYIMNLWTWLMSKNTKEIISVEGKQNCIFM